MDGSRSESEDHDAAGPSVGPGRRGRRRAALIAWAIGAVVVVAAGIAAAAGVDAPWGGADEVVRGCEGDDDPGAADPDEGLAFGSLEDWDRHADVIARVTVVDEQRGGADAADPEAEAPRFLHLRVERTFAGSAEPGDALVITSNEPYLRDADGEIVVATGPDCFTLVTGDEAVVALVGDGSDPSTSALLTHDSAFLVDGDTVARTRRSGPGVDPYEGEPLAALEGAIEEVLR